MEQENNTELLTCQSEIAALKEKVRVLEDRILAFRKLLEFAAQTESKEGEEAEYWLKIFDVKFRI